MNKWNSLFQGLIQKKLIGSSKRYYNDLGSPKIFLIYITWKDLWWCRSSVKISVSDSSFLNLVTLKNSDIDSNFCYNSSSFVWYSFVLKSCERKRYKLQLTVFFKVSLQSKGDKSDSSSFTKIYITSELWAYAEKNLRGKSKFLELFVSIWGDQPSGAKVFLFSTDPFGNAQWKTSY